MNSEDNRLDVSVVGELNLDLILYGLPEELEPEREHSADRLALTLGSSSGIFAHNLARLGSRVGFIARIGNERLGRISIERLSQGGVDVSRVRTASGITTTGLTVILAHSRYRHILTYPGTMFEMTFEVLDLDYLASARHFHLSSFFLHRTLQPRIPELFRIMKERGLTTSLDTNDDPEDRWEGGLRETLRYVILVALGLMAIYFGAAKAEVRSQGTEAYCLTCDSNPDLKTTLPSGEELPLYISPEHLQQSIHSPLGIECEACHTDIKTYPHPENQYETTRDLSRAYYLSCKKCHSTIYENTQDSMHAQVAAENPAAPVCTDCHGSHYVQKPDEPRQQVSTTCSKCHDEIYQQYENSIHGSALIDANNPDVPV